MPKNPGHTGGREPYIDHYPPLRDWLHEHGARCDWQRYQARVSVEQWFMPNGRRFVLVIHADGHGWDIYTPADTNKIDVTFRDAEIRLGLRERPADSSHEATLTERDVARVERDRARAVLREVLAIDGQAVDPGEALDALHDQIEEAFYPVSPEDARAALIAAREGASS